MKIFDTRTKIWTEFALHWQSYIWHTLFMVWLGVCFTLVDHKFKEPDIMQYIYLVTCQEHETGIALLSCLNTKDCEGSYYVSLQKNRMNGCGCCLFLISARTVGLCVITWNWNIHKKKWWYIGGQVVETCIFVFQSFLNFHI